MRFLELNLKAFGSFEDRPPIELPDPSGPGLCVVYGPNEAGKSTALRAIEALLYGIPVRSPDNFVHPYAKLRVGGRLLFDDGHELGLMRRKKAKDSLYTYDDREVQHSERLAALVERVPPALFERFYGLDHPRLVEGSAALLADDGEVGRALFGAGLGVSNLRSVLEGLEGEAAALFAPRASKPRINQSLKELAEARKEIEAASLDPKLWAEQASLVREAQEALRGLEEEIESARREHASCERRLRTLPALARRAEALAALSENASVAPLSPDFEERLRQARGDRRSADENRERAELRIERETLELDGLVSKPALLAAREPIDDLFQRVGAYQEATDQLPRREHALLALDQEIESLMSAPPSRTDETRLAALRSAVARGGSTRTLASEGTKLAERMAKASEEVIEAQADRDRFGEPFESEGSETSVRPDSREATALRAACDRALGLGPIDRRLAEARSDYDALDFEAGHLAEGLGLASGGLEALVSDAFPSHELIDAWRERFAEQAHRVERSRERGDSLRGELRDVEEGRARLASEGAVPQLDELTAQRAERDTRWSALREDVIESDVRPPSDEAGRLADGFESASSEADELGDRLRTDAKRVAEQASLDARAGRLEGDLAAVAERDAELAAAADTLAEQWQSLWAGKGVAAGTPDAMRDWRRGLDGLLGVLTQRREAERALERDRAEWEGASEALRAGLAAAGDAEGGAHASADAAADFERLDEGVALAKARLESIEASEIARRRRRESVEQADERLARVLRSQAGAQRALESWRDRWEETVTFLDVEDRASPERAVERLDEMGRLLERLGKRDELSGRVEAMRVQLAKFEADVVKLAERCGVELTGDAPVPNARQLHRMLGEAVRQETLREKTETALAEARQELADAGIRAAASLALLNALCDEAALGHEASLGHGADPAALDEALRGWRVVEEHQRVLREAEDELARLAEGRPLEELEAGRQDIDPDALVARIASLDETIAQQTEAQKRAIAELRSAGDALAAMNGSARVAELAEAAESRIAVVRRDVDRYVQLRMAKEILEKEIEDYRKENQAPLLDRAGQIFEALTLGAYPRIVSEVSASGNSLQLMAVARAGAGETARETPVSGLSAGTRDQLFLAIRLASLEDSRKRGESMPLIADDILIEFDDRRSRATLEVLADLARGNQIFLFSHHLHVAEMARDLKDDAIVIEL